MCKLKHPVIITVIILCFIVITRLPGTACAKSQPGSYNSINIKTNPDGSIIKVTGSGKLFIGNNIKNIDTLNHNNPWQCSISDINVSKDNKYLVSKNGVLYNKKMTKLLYYPSLKKGNTFKVPGTVKSIARYAFKDNKYLKKVILNKTLKQIGSYAFSESNIKTINIPQSVKKIGNNCFNGCLGLEDLDNHASLSSISDNLFYNCISLKKLNLGSSVKYIYDKAFYNCPALIYIGKNNKHYKTIDGVLYSKNMKELLKYSCSKDSVYILPDTVEVIDKYAFYNCYNLKSLTLNENITDFPLSGLSGCISLETINLPLSLKTLGGFRFIKDNQDNSYYDCVYNLPSLKEINIPDGNGYFKIYNGALYSSYYKILWLMPYGRSSLDIHKDTEFILNEKGNNSFQKITVEDSNKYFASYKGVLYDKPLKIIKVFPGMLERYEVPRQLEDASTLISYIDTYDDGFGRYDNIKGINNGGKNLKEITVENGNMHFKSSDGVLFNYEMTELYAYPRAKEGSYVIPGNVKYIDVDAFAGAYKLTTLKVPSNIKYASTNIAGCSSLKKIIFEEGITGIHIYGNLKESGYPNLMDETNIKDIYFPSTLYNIIIENINKTALFHAYGNTGFYSGQNKIKSTKNYITDKGYLYKNIGTAPGKPEFLSAVWKKQNVKLSWKNAVKGADGYLIKQIVHNKDKKTDITLKDIKNPQKTYVTLKPEKSRVYEFYIVAYKYINGIKVFGNGTHIEFESKNKVNIYDDSNFVF